MPFGDVQTPSSTVEQKGCPGSTVSGLARTVEASKYKYQGIRLLLQVQLQYRHLPWQCCAISKTIPLSLSNLSYYLNLGTFFVLIN